MKSFARLTNAERAVYIEETAAQLGLPKGSIEKDFWVCWTLRLLFELPSWGPRLTFKGGTSLSKGFGLIKRFSEDIDIVIDRDRLGFGGENSPENAPSNKQRKKRLEDLRAACEAAVQTELLPAIQAAVDRELGSGSAEHVRADASDPQTILFIYPSAFAESLLYVSPNVRIELGARSDTEPSQTPQIRPYVADVFPSSMSDAAFAVKAVAARRTLLEKVCLLHEETFRPADKPRQRRMARHYYDVWSLIRAGVAAEAIAYQGLFERVAEHRPVFFNHTWVDYTQMRRGSMRLVPPPDQRPEWTKDYQAMRLEMFWEDVPPFDELLEDVARFESELNTI